MNAKPLMLALTSVAVLWCGPVAQTVLAQDPVPPPATAYQPLSDQQLDQLLGPIALYPDPLLAQIFPAATLPTEIVLADRYVTGGGDPAQASQQPWDTSVQALVRYPTVLQYLDQNLAWTTEVGQAFLNQQQEVMESIQRLRSSAQNFGNLQSTPQEQVVQDNGDIEILPADPDVIYVPVYEPNYVYFQSGYGLTFGVGCAIGPWLNCDFDWRLHHLYFWDHNHPRPANWWHEGAAQRDAWVAHEGSVWRAQDHRDIHTTVGRTDRGWGNVVSHPQETHPPHPMTPAHPIEAPHPVEPSHPVVIHGASPVPAPSHPAPIVRPEYNGAFIGGDNSHDARAFSERGQQSVQSINRPEPVRPSSPPPVQHSAPPPSGGGGFHGGGGQPHR